jgi:transposase
MFRKSVEIDFFSHMTYETVVRKDHLVRQLDAVSDFSMIDRLVEKTYAPSRRGAPGYDPSVLFRLLLLRRVYNLSLRKVLERCQTDMAFRWFAHLNITDEIPSKATLSAFRLRLNNSGLHKVFQGTVRKAKSLGLISNTKLLVDGTIIKSNFALRRQGRLMMIISIDLLKRTDLWGEILLPKTDELEDRIAFAKGTLELLKGVHLKEKLKRKKALLERVIKQNEEKGTPDKVLHIKDEDARRTVRKGVNKAGYTTLIGIDSTSGLTTAVKTVPANQEEGQHLLELVEEHISLVGDKPKEVLADTSFGHGANLKALLDQDILPLIPPRSSYQPDVIHCSEFKYDENAGTLECPVGQVTKNQRPFREGIQFRFSTEQCKECPLKKKCTKGKHRRVEISQYHAETSLVRQLLDTKHNGHQKERMKIEYKFRQTKRFYGLHTADGFSLDAAKRQSLMTIIATNLVKTASLIFPKKKRARFTLSLST